MLETRMPSVSPLPRPAVRVNERSSRAAWTAPAAHTRESTARAAAHALPSERQGVRRAARSRMARSEARLLTFAVAGTALMCAVLVIYLAAYAHVSQLGLEQSRSNAQLRQARLLNDELEADLTRLQSPARIAAAAQAMGMTAGAKHVTYLSAQDTAAWTADGGSADGQNTQVANSGTATDGSAAAAFDH